WNIMRLAILVEHAGLGIVLHSGGAAFVCGVAHRFDVALITKDFGVARSQNLLHPAVHVLHHSPVVVLIAGMKSDLRDSIGVLVLWVDFEVVIVIGQALAVTTQRNRAAIALPKLLFQARPPTFKP